MRCKVWIWGVLLIGCTQNVNDNDGQNSGITNALATGHPNSVALTWYKPSDRGSNNLEVASSHIGFAIPSVDRDRVTIFTPASKLLGLSSQVTQLVVAFASQTPSSPKPQTSRLPWDGDFSPNGEIPVVFHPTTALLSGSRPSPDTLLPGRFVETYADQGIVDLAAIYLPMAFLPKTVQNGLRDNLVFANHLDFIVPSENDYGRIDAGDRRVMLDGGADRKQGVAFCTPRYNCPPATRVTEVGTWSHMRQQWLSLFSTNQEGLKRNGLYECEDENKRRSVTAPADDSDIGGLLYEADPNFNFTKIYGSLNDVRCAPRRIVNNEIREQVNRFKPSTNADQVRQEAFANLSSQESSAWSVLYRLGFELPGDNRAFKGLGPDDTKVAYQTIFTRWDQESVVNGTRTSDWIMNTANMRQGQLDAIGIYRDHAWARCKSGLSSPIEIPQPTLDNRSLLETVTYEFQFGSTQPTGFDVKRNASGLVTLSYKGSVLTMVTRKSPCDPKPTKINEYQLRERESVEIHYPAEHVLGALDRTHSVEFQLHYVSGSERLSVAIVAVPKSVGPMTYDEPGRIEQRKAFVRSLVPLIAQVNLEQSVMWNGTWNLEILTPMTAPNSMIEYTGTTTSQSCEIVRWWIVTQPLVLEDNDFNALTAALHWRTAKPASQTLPTSAHWVKQQLPLSRN